MKPDGGALDDSLIATLLARPLGEFVAARDALVKQLRAARRTDEAKAIAALRRPAAAAWAIDAAARAAPAEAKALLAAGRAARAQLARGGDNYRDASKALRAAVARFGGRAAAALEEGGHGAGPDVLRRIEKTLHSAASSGDEAIAHALQEGLLFEELAAAGFDLAAGLAPTQRREIVRAPTSAPAPAPERKQDRAAAKRAATAQRRADEDERAARTAEREAEAADGAAVEAETAAREARRIADGAATEAMRVRERAAVSKRAAEEAARAAK